jgi:membrane associated rhomboid family serine protease
MIKPGGFNLLPVVVKNLLIINVLFFLAKMALGQMGIDLDHKLGMHYYKSPLFEPYQMVTYLFMHGNFQHLFFNMFAVWMFGNSVENAWGPKRFLTYYLITGFGAAILHYAVVQYQVSGIESMLTDQEIGLVLKEGADAISEYKNFVDPNMAQLNILYNTPIVGASGALFGILLAFGMMFPNTELYLMFFPIPIKAKYFVAGYGAIELFSGFQNTSGDNVAHFAHLGGMLFGFILIKFWGNNSNNQFRQN